jgi:hypothetical protein
MRPLRLVDKTDRELLAVWLISAEPAQTATIGRGDNRMLNSGF